MIGNARCVLNATADVERLLRRAGGTLWQVTEEDFGYILWKFDNRTEKRNVWPIRCKTWKRLSEE